MLGPMLDTSYQLIVGPLLVGVIMNALIFGICIMQLITYSGSGYKDNWWILAMLGWMYAIDAFQVCSSVSMLWYYVVENFVNPAALTSAPWQYATLPIFSSIAPVPIQHFMAYRIMRFSRSRLLFVLISALSLGQASLACVSAAQGLTHTSIESHVTLVPVAAAWIVLSVTCDTTITTLLMYYLLKSRTGFEKTDSIITRVCMMMVMAAVPVTIVCTVDLCLLTAMPNNNLHYMFALPVGRLYTTTLLSTLNERKNLRSQLEDSASSPQKLPLTPVTTSRLRLWRQSVPMRVDVDSAIQTAQTVDLESVRDALRDMKADNDEVCSVEELPPCQNLMFSKL